MKNFKRGTIVETIQGKIGEILDSEGYVIKNSIGTTISEVYEDFSTCDAYRIEINPLFSTEKVPAFVKLGKSIFPIFNKNLRYLPTIYFKFKDNDGKYVHLRQNQETGLILKKILDKTNMRYYMFSSEEEMKNHVEPNF